MRPAFRAAHAFAMGHTRHRGSTGTHVVAPSSITAWLSSPGCSRASRASISAPAFAHTARWPAVPFTSSSIANTRASTRATLPSTSGVRSPKAIDAIAPAVYGPIPFTSRSSLARDGNVLPASDFAPACRLRARE